MNNIKNRIQEDRKKALDATFTFLKIAVDRKVRL